MHETKFSRWARWSARDELAGMECPGVYAIAITPTNIARRPFSWRKDIVYVGMTVAAPGLRGRLRSFDRTVSGKRLAHGGADRVRYKHRDYEKLCSHLYVAVAPTRCDPTSNAPADLMKMGNVVRFEYVCLAEFSARRGRLPEFNDKRKSHKDSRKALTFG